MPHSVVISYLMLTYADLIINILVLFLVPSLYTNPDETIPLAYQKPKFRVFYAHNNKKNDINKKNPIIGCSTL